MTLDLSAPSTCSLTEAATVLGISRDLAYRLAAAGDFPCPVLRIGRRYRVPLKALDELVNGPTPSAEVIGPEGATVYVLPNGATA